jgi:hypothetical protein
MSLEQLQQLKASLEQHSGVIEGMLEEYGLFVNTAQARFIHTYVKSLELDFELAMTRGQHSELILITKDLKELSQATATRLEATLHQEYQEQQA